VTVLERDEPVNDEEPQALPEDAPKPPYEPPRIIVYDESALADIVGPAVACARWSPI